MRASPTLKHSMRQKALAGDTMPRRTRSAVRMLEMSNCIMVAGGIAFEGVGCERGLDAKGLQINYSGPKSNLKMLVTLKEVKCHALTNFKIRKEMGSRDFLRGSQRRSRFCENQRGEGSYRFFTLSWWSTASTGVVEYSNATQSWRILARYVMKFSQES